MVVARIFESGVGSSDLDWLWLTEEEIRAFIYTKVVTVVRG